MCLSQGPQPPASSVTGLRDTLSKAVWAAGLHVLSLIPCKGAVRLFPRLPGRPNSCPRPGAPASRQHRCPRPALSARSGQQRAASGFGPLLTSLSPEGGGGGHVPDKQPPDGNVEGGGGARDPHRCRACSLGVEEAAGSQLDQAGEGRAVCAPPSSELPGGDLRNVASASGDPGPRLGGFICSSLPS